jgi:hypothetical protein
MSAMAAGAVTADGRARVLADGNEIPLLGTDPTARGDGLGVTVAPKAA